jgi:hypothetical protein
MQSGRWTALPRLGDADPGGAGEPGGHPDRAQENLNECVGMKDRKKAMDVGLIVPEEKLCVKCYNKESRTFKEYDFKAGHSKIAHPNPSAKKGSRTEEPWPSNPLSAPLFLQILVSRFVGKQRLVYPGLGIFDKGANRVRRGVRSARRAPGCCHPRKTGSKPQEPTTTLSSLWPPSRPDVLGVLARGESEGEKHRGIAGSPCPRGLRRSRRGMVARRACQWAPRVATSNHRLRA